MKIISSYSKKLHCQVGNKSIGIEPNKVIGIEDKMGRALLNSPWITESREGFEAPVIKPCGVPCKKEKPIEKEVKNPIEKKEGLVREKKETIENEVPKKKKIEIREKSKVDSI